MIIALVKHNYRYLTTLNISKLNMNANKCYFRHLKSENEVHITFLFKISEENIRQFNFNRKPNDSLGTIVSRIVANIQKIFNKTNKKNKNNKEIKETDVKLCDIKNDFVSESTTCSELIEKKIPMKLNILGQIYDVIYNSPWVTSIGLPHSILAGFPVYPVAFDIIFGDKEHSTFKWYSSISVNEKGNKIADTHLKWEHVGSDYTYTPTSQEIGKILKVECTPGKLIS